VNNESVSQNQVEIDLSGMDGQPAEPSGAAAELTFEPALPPVPIGPYVHVPPPEE
jgi:hypothetical protein